MAFGKLILLIVFSIICGITGQCLYNAGATLVGESGVSQEIVTAIVGVIGCFLGYVLILYSLFKPDVYAIKTFVFN